MNKYYELNASELMSIDGGDDTTVTATISVSDGKTTFSFSYDGEKYTAKVSIPLGGC